MWPFDQIFQLIFVDQEEQEGDIIRCFKLDPASLLFKQSHPHSEMNLASGCPKFAPLSILDNPTYVKNDNDSEVFYISLVMNIQTITLNFACMDTMV